MSWLRYATPLKPLLAQTRPKNKKKLDTQRKRLIASIFAWRASLGTTADMNLVKAIACRAAEVPEGYALSVRFNSIPEEKLRSLYNAFKHMAKGHGQGKGNDTGND